MGDVSELGAGSGTESVTGIGIGDLEFAISSERGNAAEGMLDGKIGSFESVGK